MKNTIDKDKIKELSTQESSKIVLSRSDYHVILKSSQLGNILKSVIDYLQNYKRELFTWFKGYVLHYDNIKVLDKVAPISYDNCIHINIAGDFYIFTPEIGDEFEVIVVQKKFDYIDCLLYGSVHIGLIHKNSSNINVNDVIKVKISQKKEKNARIYLNAEFISKCDTASALNAVVTNEEKLDALNTSSKFEDELDTTIVKVEEVVIKMENEDMDSCRLKKSKRGSKDSELSSTHVKRKKKHAEEELEVVNKPKKHKKFNENC